MPHVPIFQGELTSLVFCEPFDVIVLNQVLEHVPDDVAVLQAMRSLLRPTGVMILGVPNEGSWLQRLRLAWAGGAATTDHCHFYNETAIRAKINQCGFIVDSIYREVFYPGFDRLYYGLTARPWGFRFLQWMTKVWPSGCSDYYFECRIGRQQPDDKGG